jgi:hypothetical protein
MAVHDEGTAPEGAAPQGTKPGPKKVSPLRQAIGVVLLVAFSAVAYLEWDANRRSSAAMTRLNQALENEEGDLLSKDQVEKMIGRQPDGPGVAQGPELKVTYTWRGVFRKYPLVAIYIKNPPVLLRTE